MSDTVIKCKKGWFIASSNEQGEYVPFFTIVRDKDVIWDVRTINEAFPLIMTSVDDAKLNYPNATITVTVDNWHVTINEDCTFTARGKFSIGESSVISDNNREIKMNIELPFTTKNDDNLNIQVTKASTKTDIICSREYVVPAYNGETLENISVNLYNTIGTFTNLALYRDQYVYVQVSGLLE